MKNTRKGFTLVELLVVIAILAILATVSIVGYTSFINRANDSVAQQELTQIRDYYIAGQYLVPPTVVSEDLLADLGLEGKIEEGTVNGKTCYKYTSKGTAYWFKDTNEVTVGVAGWEATPEIPKEFPWKDSNVVFVGDSITAASNAYHKVLNERGVFGSVTPMGLNGSCVSSTSTKAGVESLTQRLGGIISGSTDADLIVIFMGTNDYSYNTPLGTVDDIAEISFCGALNIVIDRIQQNCPNSQLVFATPLHRYCDDYASLNNNPDDTQVNTKGHNLGDYVNAIKAVCNKNDIPVIDLYNLCTLDPKDTSIFPDGLHPSAAGHAVVADLIYEALFDIPKKEAGDIEVEVKDPKELPSSMPLIMGNRLVGGTYLSNKDRATIASNLYLMPGDRIDYIGGSQYSWIASPATNGEFSGGSSSAYVTPGQTWSQSSWLVTEEGWYVFAFKKGSDFDFSEGGDPNDFFDYISITRSETTQLQLQIGMKFLNNAQQNRASTNKNLYLEAGTIITYKSGYQFAVYATTSEWSTTQTSGTTWITSYTITESGYYGISVRKTDDAAFDFTNGDSTDPYDYVIIE